MYSIAKTANKAAMPGAIVIIVNISLAIAKARGVDISADDLNTIWTVAGCGWAGLSMIINYFKNHKKK